MTDPKRRKLEQLLAANDLVGAEKLCRNAIAKNRYDVEMTALLGAIQLQGGRLDAAERNLKRAINLAPSFPKPQHDLGTVHMRRREFEKAAKQYGKALGLDRNLKPAWLGYLDALRELGEFDEIREVCTQLLDKNPDDPDVLRSMAIVRVNEGDAREAERLFQKVADIQPRSVRALTDLARFRASRHQYPQVIDLLRRITALEPQNPRFYFMLADHLFMTGFPEKALESYEQGLALAPEFPPGRAGRAHALRALGRTEEVVAEYRSCIQQGINPGESWWSLASLRTYEFSEDDVEAMRSRLQSADEQNGLFIEFALGKAMDDREDYDAAWEYYESANRRRRSQLSYDPGRFETQVGEIIERTGPDWFIGAGKGAEPEATPIFILGMPRSGSTLVEQILAAHSMVEATTELPYMTALGERHFLAGPVPDPDPDFAAIGEAYMKAAEVYRREGKPFFIDKMPDNFQFAGLAAVALPGAKIIDVRRNPMDTCIGNYRQWFGQGKDYAYDLNELGERYLQYHRIMAHWDDVMPGRVLRVDYERLVAEQEAGTRRILEWCGLPWEDACLAFHEVDRPVTTASSEQVRQPIYAGAVGFWKHYEKHLGQLAELLAPVSA